MGCSCRGGIRTAHCAPMTTTWLSAVQPLPGTKLAGSAVWLIAPVAARAGDLLSMLTSPVDTPVVRGTSALSCSSRAGRSTRRRRHRLRRNWGNLILGQANSATHTTSIDAFGGISVGAPGDGTGFWANGDPIGLFGSTTGYDMSPPDELIGVAGIGSNEGGWYSGVDTGVEGVSGDDGRRASSGRATPASRLTAIRAVPTRQPTQRSERRHRQRQ
jgi:hypothetical protein